MGVLLFVIAKSGSLHDSVTTMRAALLDLSLMRMIEM